MTIYSRLGGEMRRVRREKRERLKGERPLDDDFDDELELEKYAARYAERRGFCSLKLSAEATGEDGWPDRLFFGAASNHATCFLIEFKDLGEKAEPRQRLVHRVIYRKYGIKPHVVDRWSEFLNVWRRETGQSG